jgi:hypothetical protein
VWQKFAEACRTEKEDVIWEALIHKAKVLASVERACAGKDEEMSSEDILKKLVRNAEGACKQVNSPSLLSELVIALWNVYEFSSSHVILASFVRENFSLDDLVLLQMEDKHKESLERLPNTECALCCEEFSRKRKRACLDPCGHASACADCATQEWRRTNTCFVCKARIEKPIAVPFQLYF